MAQIAIAHAQFETIHPFADGNGRTGRLLMPVMLAAEGYPPLYVSGTLLRHRRAYHDALHRLPTYLLGHPVITVNQVADAHEISFVAASRAVNQLVERKILTEPKRRRNRVFHAAEILARLERE